MASMEAVEEVIAMLRDAKPAEWDRFRGMDPDDYGRILKTWIRVLMPIEDGMLLQAAVVAARKAGAFLPSPGDLYQAALDLLDDSPPAGDAWGIALKYACTPRFAKPDVKLPERVRLALRGMGDPGNWEVDKYGMYRVQFEKAYSAEREAWRARVPERKLLE